MSKHTKIILLILECVVLAAAVALCVILLQWQQPSPPESQPTTAEPGTTAPATQATTVPETTEATVTETTEAPTEPEPTEVSYWLSFAGDCTLGNQRGDTSASSFLKTVGDDYAWPFAGVLPYFEADDFTLVNFEGTLTTSTNPVEKRFNFKAPAVYATCLTAGAIDCVNLANNHTYDYGDEGYADTKEALTAEGIPYVGKDETILCTTPSGLVIGIYSNTFNANASTVKSRITELKKAGAEIIIFSMHWGVEGSYRPTDAQKTLAHTAIDAGADIVFGHHPHVLQPIEEYNGGIIYYSLGNFSFGGNRNPRDKDTAIIQQEIVRGVDGTIRLGQTRIIPCSVSSVSNLNDYQPTPLKEGTAAYDRILSKLDGSFTGPDLVVNYDS